MEAEYGRRDREVDARVPHREAADDVDVDVAAAEPLCHPLHGADEHLEPARVDPARAPARGGAVLADEQRLHLHAERPAPLDDRGDRGARARHALREEQPRRVRDLREAVRPHLEEPDLVRRAEAVLHRPQRADRRVAVPLEEEHRVDRVLEEARAGEPALLRHLPDEHQRRPRRARGGDERLRGGPDLRRAPRSPLDSGRTERLHAVDDAERGPVRGDELGELLRVGRLGDEQGVGVEAEACGAERHLRRRLLPRDVERPRPGPGAHREQERRLPDAGFPADEHGAAGHEAAPERAVELSEARRPARQPFGGILGERPRRRRRARTGARGPRLLEGAPCAAPRAAAGPARRTGAAGVA